MGMDLIELTMNLEDEFSVRIPDDDASRLETVGQTYDYLRQRLGSTAGDRCSSMLVFHRLRQAMVNLLEIPRDCIRPATPVGELFRGLTASEQRTRLAGAAGLVLPRVGRVWGYRLVAVVIALAMVGMLALPMLAMDGPMAGVCSFLAFCMFITAMKIASVCHPGPVRLVSTNDSFGAFVRKTVVINKLPAITSQWTDERIWLALTEIISETLGVRVEDLKRETHFINDLHVG